MHLYSPSKKVLNRYVFSKDTSGRLPLSGPVIRHTLGSEPGGTARLLNQSGLGTLEIVILIAVLLAVALLFNDQIRRFADKLFKVVFNDGKVIQQLN